jgi:hypothetical protein
MQSRLGHVHIGEYYNDFNIPEEYSCPCGENYQTHLHILTECPLYEEHNKILLRDDELNIIPTNLFGTKEGIARFTEFLTKRMHSHATRRINLPPLCFMLCYAYAHPPSPTSRTIHHSAILHTSTKPYDPPLPPWLPDAQHPRNIPN